MAAVKVSASVLLLWVTAVAFGEGGGEGGSLASEIEKAQRRLQLDYISKLWYGASEAVAESQDKILTIYTHYTMHQAENVLEHIAQHQNITRRESSDKRSKILQAKDLTKLIPTLRCMFASEENTLRTYKITGYNLYNCIKMAQNEMETAYLSVVKNLESIKSQALASYELYSRSLDNCAQTSCVMSNLFRSIIHYEKLQEEVSTNLTEVNNLSMRYVLTRIAMGCVSNSLAQITENYNIGKGLADECLQPTNGTSSSGNSQTQPTPHSSPPANLTQLFKH